MKKFLALVLALLTILSVSLVACGNNDDNPEETTTEPSDIWTGEATGDGTTTGGGDGTTQPANMGWTDDGNTVYVAYYHECNLRTSDSEKNESNIAGTAKFGDSFTRVKYNDKWSVVLVNGAERYIKTEYLSSDNGYSSYQDVTPTTVYVTADSLVLRWAVYSEDTAEDTAAVYLDKGDSLTQTGVSANGKWIRVTYKDATLYCSGTYVSTTAPSDDTTETTGSSGLTPPAIGG